MIAQRQALPANEQMMRSARICVRSLALVGGYKTVALYAAIRGEVHLGGLDAALRGMNVRVCYPRVEGPGLSFHEGRFDALVPTGKFKIPEPLPDAPIVMPEQLDALVIPGLAFDPQGHRIGWGAGFYDALLRRAPHARRIGVCYHFQLVESVPHGPADEHVHVVVTEKSTTTIKEITS
jgi:5-formyltetrahydrofolate cyclo-ligase